ncbi:myogenesis-regulating glycosidase-like [Mya arenaria]|uniref:myogenesis-regulating glycosidase-like n=1 Tax=Mya arenaria TaxID=6604 RepID=UPI0022E1163F|nr:myogenesis-regulating glycosidase-like [Mya arenaria]XP_052816812.1 myogenesis-regulating glycosidase-like [Mya arenaria]
MLNLHWRRLRSKYPWIQLLKSWRCWLMIVFTAVLLFYACASYGQSPNMFQALQTISMVWVGDIEFDFLTGLYFLKQGKDVYLRGSMPDAQQMDGRPVHCGDYNKSHHLCASWIPKVKLEVELHTDEHAVCHTLTWSAGYDNYKPHTCFSMSDTNWYGGSLFSDQKWPLNKVDLPFQAYRTRNLENSVSGENLVGNVLDWFWINSHGVAVIVDSSYPLHVSINQPDKLLCFYSQSDYMSVLQYKVCKAGNLKKIHRYVLSKFVHLPMQLPKDEVFQKPIWSTYPMYKNSVNQENLLTFSKDVMDKELERGVMDIHDVALSLFNSDPFARTKFMNSHQSLMYVRDYGFETFLSVSPFVNVSMKTFNESVFLKDSYNNPIVLDYHGIKTYVIDLLSEHTYNWFVEQLKGILVQFGLDGYHLTGGEMEYLEFNVEKHFKTNNINIELYAKRYSSIAQKFYTKTISSFAVQSQRSAVIVQISSNVSSWTSKGGINSVIPSVLTLGILGYPYVIPNIVGGPGVYKTNSSSSEGNLGVPDRELYIRWLSLAAYMPCMAFSFPPWMYSEEVMQIAKKFIDVHKNVVAPHVIKAAREYESTGAPVIRPLWWSDPIDPGLQTVDDQFTVGDDLLVAPVLSLGQTHRDVLLPHGRWRDELSGKEVEGKTMLQGVHVPLGQIATYTRVKT